MTELAICEENNQIAQATPPAPAAPSSALVQWANDARAAANIATSLAQTSFVPTALRGKNAEITAVILAGQELGLPPVAALRSMDVIQGTPALRAHAMRGLVQSNGHSVQVVESSESRCVVRGRRAGETQWQEVVWTTERAARLGLTGKPEWKRQPQTMLVARATGEICRLVASDVLFAMPYAAEEFDGGATPDGQFFAAPPVTVAEIMEAAPQAPTIDGSPSATPGSTCGWCEQPGHHEDDCPRREDSACDDTAGGA